MTNSGHAGAQRGVRRLRALGRFPCNLAPRPVCRRAGESFPNCIARHDAANPLRSERSGPYRVALCHRSAAASLLVRPGGGSLGGSRGLFLFRNSHLLRSLLVIWNIGELMCEIIGRKTPENFGVLP